VIPEVGAADGDIESVIAAPEQDAGFAVAQHGTGLYGGQRKFLNYFYHDLFSC
jgi:hypothetical protein